MITVRGHPFMTSALRGEGGVGPKDDEVRERGFSTVNLNQMRTRGEGVKKSENLADVINGWPLGPSTINSWPDRICPLSIH